MTAPKPWNPESGITLYEDRKLWIDYARELKEHNDGMEGLIDHLIETCPESKPIILAWIEAHLKPKP